MKRSVAALALVALGARASPQETPTFPAGVELVRIDVVVVDHDGKPVTGLTAADFEVTEGGKPHEIVSFEPIVVHVPTKVASTEAVAPARVSEPTVPAPEENRYFLIFFDDVHVSALSAERVRAQLVPFLEKETGEGDWVTVIAPLQGLRWTARTAFERSQLPAVVQSLKGQLVRKLHTKQSDTDYDDPTDYEAMRTSEYGGREASAPRGPSSNYSPSAGLLAEEIYAVAKRRVRQTLGAVSEAIESLAGFRGRKSLVLYSEGFIKSPSMPDYDHAIELARRAHVSVYFIDPRGLRTGISGAGAFASTREPDPLTQLDTDAGGSAYVALATGGRASISNDVTGLLHEAAVESSSYYLLGFLPSPGEPGERKLKVRVRRDGLKVRATERYVVGSPAAPAKPVPPAVLALGRVSDAPDVPIHVGTLFLDAPSKGPVTTTLAVELDASKGETGEKKLNLLVEARPLGKGEAVRDSAELSLPADHAAVATRELHLAPGVWQARVVVRDSRTEKIGSVLHTFEVPANTGLRLSSPILTDELEASSVPKPKLRLDRHFRAGGALYCQYRVFGASIDPASGKPRVSAGFAIARGGQSVQEDAPTPIEPAGDGQILRFLGVGLAGFEPGDYTLTLRVKDEVSGETREVREPFAVIPR